MAYVPINPTQLTPPRVAFIDERSGAISREWYRFFLSLLTATQDNIQQELLVPDVNSLLATYDAMLAGVAQAAETQPDCCASGQAVLQSDIQGLSLTPAGATLSALAVVQTDIQALLLVPASLNGTVTSVAASGGTTGLTFTGSPITTSGTLTLGGTLGVANGGTGTTTTFTTGSIIFAGASGVYSQDNTNFFWDDTNNRLGIGTTGPASKLHVVNNADGEAFRVQRGGGSNFTLLRVNMDDAANTATIEATAGAGNPALVFSTVGSDRMRISDNGNVGIGATANASAILDVQSTTKGLRLPNMTTTQKNAISSPAAGLMVFDTTLAKACIYSGSAWEIITSV